ncbi:hypothetical protein I3760_10G090700 [Carya illinoinensis]|nr:hypothetical protein I3760_10G090700 [Carya illinoinensis]
MADEPSLTRWSFADFKMFYDAKFGRKRLPESANGPTADKPSSNVNSAAVTSNGNIHVNNTSDMAIFEMFRGQALSSTHTNGILSYQTDERPQKSLLPPFESAEMRTLAESLSRDIIRGSPDVSWESIKGLENAKQLLKEAVVMPIKYPKYITGLLSPWKGILLFGPPGTGKTMLARLLQQSATTLFSIFQHLLLSANGVVTQRS